MSLKTLLQDYQILLNSSPSSSQAQSLLRDLKYQTTILASKASKTTEDLQLIREFNELNVFSSLKTRNQAEFETSMARLLVVYEDTRRILSKSSNENLLRAVYLLSLLSNNRVQEFHVGLESVPFEDLQDKYLNFVIAIEQSLTLGNYKEMLRFQNNAPHEFFNVWLDRIVETIRVEIARSAEKAYVSLDVKDALGVFLINSEESLLKFVKSQEKTGSDNGILWRLEGKKLYFDSFGKGGKHINADELMCNTIQYAHELERII